MPKAIQHSMVVLRYLCLWFAFLTASCSHAVRLDAIRLPSGFTITVFADNLRGATSMTLGSAGTVFAGTREEGKVYAVRDTDGDFKADKVSVIADGLDMPNGVAFSNGDLYVAEVNRIVRFDTIEQNLPKPPPPTVVIDSLPADRHHGWRIIRFGPDGRLYVSVGAPCNICEPGDPYAAILRMQPDGSALEIFARGVRNTAGFDWDMATGTLWFTDNGRDWLGDYLPPDELNCAPRAGLHFGYPYRHGADVIDPKFGAREFGHDCVLPAFELGAHVAPLGMRFYDGTMFPERYRNQIFIAEHGSRNRIVPAGHRIVVVRLSGKRAVEHEVFASGWLQGKSAWGGPVDILVLPDGSILVSDDRVGAVYRISYQDHKKGKGWVVAR